jgi:hypothetical protein
VDGGVVALVAGEAVAGVEGVHLDHQAVAGGLGEDGGGGDGQALGVAADHGAAVELERLGQLEKRVAVDEDAIGAERQALHGAAHGEARGPVDVELGDLLHAGGGDGPGDSGGLDLGFKAFAGLGGQLLGVVQAIGDARGVEDARAGVDRPGPGTAAGLVHARDGRRAVGFVAVVGAGGGVSHIPAR